MIKNLREALKGMWSLLLGLNITRRNFFRPQITVHYPRKTNSLEGYRGHIELVCKDDDPYTSKCIACIACSRLCPTGCISLRIKREASESRPERAAPPDMAHMPIKLKKKYFHPEKVVRGPKTFHLNYNFCSLCGLCVENCPAGALRFTSDVYLAGYTRQEFEYDLLARMRHQAQEKEDMSGNESGYIPGNQQINNDRKSLH